MYLLFKLVRHKIHVFSLIKGYFLGFNCFDVRANGTPPRGASETVVTDH